MTIPASTDDLTPEWFSEILGEHVSAVEVIDAHSGTTGRARVAIASSADLPETLFVKLQPFAQNQRDFLRAIGLGVAEARLYGEVGKQLPVRTPAVWWSECEPSDGSFIMVLENLGAPGCRRWARSCNPPKWLCGIGQHHRGPSRIWMPSGYGLTGGLRARASPWTPQRGECGN